MGKKRIYRHDIKCPECGSNWVCKNGHQTNGKQKFRCNDCNRTFTENPERVYLTKDKKNKIVSMFSERNTQSAIARIMRKNYNTIHSLIYREGKKTKKRIEKRIERIKEKKAKVISIDEKWLTPQIKDLWIYEGARKKGKSKSVISLEIYLALIFIYWGFIYHLLH